MVWLGFWQLDRLHQKEALLARYQTAQTMSAEAAWPASPAEAEQALYRRATVDCRTIRSLSTFAGRNVRNESGLSAIAVCEIAGGDTATIVLGWSRDPNVLTPWSGGLVSGVIAPGPRLVADPPLAGLQASAKPDPSNIPNNHLAYAVQWFLFALTALVIYALALRKRLAAGADAG